MQGRCSGPYEMEKVNYRCCEMSESVFFSGTGSPRSLKPVVVVVNIIIGIINNNNTAKSL